MRNGTVRNPYSRLPGRTSVTKSLSPGRSSLLVADPFFAARVQGLSARHFIVTDEPAELTDHDKKIVAEQLFRLLQVARVSTAELGGQIERVSGSMYKVFSDKLVAFKNSSLARDFVDLCRGAIARFSLNLEQSGISASVIKAMVDALAQVDRKLLIDQALDLSPKMSYVDHELFILKKRNWIFSDTLEARILQVANERSFTAFTLEDYRELISFLLHASLVYGRCSPITISQENFALQNIVDSRADQTELKRTLTAILNRLQRFGVGGLGLAFQEHDKGHVYQRLMHTSVKTLIEADSLESPLYSVLDAKLNSWRWKCFCILAGVALLLIALVAALYAAILPKVHDSNVIMPSALPAPSTSAMPTPSVTPANSSSAMPSPVVPFAPELQILSFVCTSVAGPVSNAIATLQLSANKVLGLMSVVITGATLAGCGNPAEPPSGGTCKFSADQNVTLYNITVSGFGTNMGNVTVFAAFAGNIERSLSVPYPANCSSSVMFDSPSQTLELGV